MAKMTVRAMWAAKLAGKDVPAASATAHRTGSTPRALPNMQRTPFQGQVLGIDPSLGGTGLALIEFPGGSRQPLMLRCETVKIHPKLPMPDALAEIHRSITRFIEDFQIKHVALEQTIYVQNFQTAQILGAARGAAITAAALRNLPIFQSSSKLFCQSINQR